MINAVVWDFGGVLLDWDPRYVYRELFDDTAAMEHFLAEVTSAEWHAENDRGVRYGESCAALAARHPEHAELIWTWWRRSEDMIAGPIAGSVAVLEELQAAGVPCYGLTNMEAETYPLRRERYAFLRSLRGTVVSSAEGVVKPDPEIFRRLLARFGLTAGETVFIDDSEANVTAARALGMVAVRFESPERLRSELSILGLPVRPGRGGPSTHRRHSGGTMARAIYTAEATVKGGRNGHGATSDGMLDVELRMPTELGGEGGGTNPEQLFAVGYAACFEGALGVAARRAKVELGDVSIDSHVLMFPNGEGGF